MMKFNMEKVKIKVLLLININNRNLNNCKILFSLKHLYTFKLIIKIKYFSILNHVIVCMLAYNTYYTIEYWSRKVRLKKIGNLIIFLLDHLTSKYEILKIVY